RRRPLPRGQEAPRVEGVMLLDEERAEAADPPQVGGRRAPDDRAGLGGRGHTGLLIPKLRRTSNSVSFRNRSIASRATCPFAPRIKTLLMSDAPPSTSSVRRALRRKRGTSRGPGGPRSAPSDPRPSAPRWQWHRRRRRSGAAAAPGSQ